MGDEDVSSPLEALKAAEKARLLEQFERDWALAESLAAKYPNLFAIVPRSNAAAQPPTTNAASLEPQTNEQRAFDGSVAGLVHCYRTDDRSPYKTLKYRTRENYDNLLRRVSHDLGPQQIKNLDAECMEGWHRQWSADGKVAMGHSLIGMLRGLASFGSKVLKDPACRELRMTLHDIKAPPPQARKEQLTAEHAIAIRAKAHEMGVPSIALAQALQFELRLPQREVIGEWVPVSEVAPFSDVLWRHRKQNRKWIRGLKWNELDHNFVLRHPILSKKGKVPQFDLRQKWMVMEELRKTNRADLPASGPMIVAEYNGHPWMAVEFRRKWRQVANAAGMPKEVFNMDSRTKLRRSTDEEDESDPGLTDLDLLGAQSHQ
jgi:hypothetical protein